VRVPEQIVLIFKITALLRFAKSQATPATPALRAQQRTIQQQTLPVQQRQH